MIVVRVFGVGYARIVIGCGAVGTVLGLIGIADRLIDFLVILGLIVPPIAAFYVTDFFILGRRDYSMAPAGRRVNATGLIACALGGAVGLAMYLHRSLAHRRAGHRVLPLRSGVLCPGGTHSRAPTPITRRNRNRRTFQYTFALTPIIIYPFMEGGQR